MVNRFRVNACLWWKSRAKLAETWVSSCWELLVGSGDPRSRESLFELVTVEVRTRPGFASRHQWRRSVRGDGSGLRREHWQFVCVGFEFRSSRTKPIESAGGFGNHAVGRDGRYSPWLAPAYSPPHRLPPLRLRPLPQQHLRPPRLPQGPARGPASHRRLRRKVRAVATHRAAVTRQPAGCPPQRWRTWRMVEA